MTPKFPVMDGERIQTQIARFPNEAATQGDPSVVDVPLANASACHRSIHTTGGNPVGLTLMALSIMAIAILMGACGGGNGETGPQPEDARVTVEEIVNQVETNRPRGSDTGEFLNARVGQDLLTGDGVKTLRDSEARVDIVVLGHFRIARTKPNTVWRLGQFAVDRDTVIELDQGKIFVFDEGFREDRPTVDVVTPAGTASARGICELANDQGSVVLTDEQKSTMTAQAAPIEPQAMGELDLLEFTHGLRPRAARWLSRLHEYPYCLRPQLGYLRPCRHLHAPTRRHLSLLLRPQICPHRHQYLRPPRLPH